MDWNTLIAVVLGGLIATIGSILNNRFQSKEHDKDRQEQRREARTQLALELMRTKIKIIDDDIDDILRTTDVVAHASFNRYRGKLSDDEMREHLDSQISGKHSKLYTLGEAHTDGDRIVHSLGDEFSSQFKRFNELCLKYCRLVLSADFVWDNRQEENALSNEIISSAAKLHNMLEEKLLSIRDD